MVSDRNLADGCNVVRAMMKETSATAFKIEWRVKGGEKEEGWTKTSLKHASQVNLRSKQG